MRSISMSVWEIFERHMKVWTVIYANGEDIDRDFGGCGSRTSHTYIQIIQIAFGNTIQPACTERGTMRESESKAIGRKINLFA